MSDINVKLKAGAICAVLLIAVLCFFGLIGRNADDTFEIVQYPNGNVVTINEPTWYMRWFGSVKTYPRYIQIDYNSDETGGKDDVPGSWAVKVTLNDGGWGFMDSTIKIALPSTEPEQRAFHRYFGGSMQNIESAIWAHLSDSMKSAGPVMSTSEHQSARRSEYNALVQEQLDNGIYEMRKVERQLLDQTDEKGRPITVYATEVVLKDGKAEISKPSPFLAYGIKVVQFSITDVRYDPQTLKQFTTKKEAFLAAESSKAQREKEVQERLMVEERGKREKAEAEAIALKEKATQTINADREKQVAETNALREKIVAETNAQREFNVAELTKKQAEVRANQELEVAKIGRLAAEEDAKKQIVLAQAKKESIELGGAITEEKRVLAEIQAKRDVEVAIALAKVQTPSTVISGSGSGTGSSGTGDLLNLVLLKSMGVLKDEPKK